VARNRDHCTLLEDEFAFPGQALRRTTHAAKLRFPDKGPAGSPTAKTVPGGSLCNACRSDDRYKSLSSRDYGGAHPQACLHRTDIPIIFHGARREYHGFRRGRTSGALRGQTRSAETTTKRTCASCQQFEALSPHYGGLTQKLSRRILVRTSAESAHEYRYYARNEHFLEHAVAVGIYQDRGEPSTQPLVYSNAAELSAMSTRHRAARPIFATCRALQAGVAGVGLRRRGNLRLRIWAGVSKPGRWRIPLPSGESSRLHFPPRRVDAD